MNCLGVWDSVHNLAEEGAWGSFNQKEQVRYIIVVVGVGLLGYMAACTRSGGSMFYDLEYILMTASKHNIP